MEKIRGKVFMKRVAIKRIEVFSGTMQSRLTLVQ